MGGAVLAGPVLAADTTMPAPHAQMGAASGGDMNAAPSKATKAARPDQVEKRLATLHRELKITPQQEDKWAAFAQTVRDNETRMHDLLMSRHQARTASAVDDLRNFGDITEAHASGIKRLVSPFQDLYATMPDAQKHNADQVFARYEGRSEARQVSAAKPRS
jgi:hypothetical protein